MLFLELLISAGCRCYSSLVVFQHTFDVLVCYSSCTCDDWYDLYLLVSYYLALNLEIYILAHLLCGLLLDVVVTWNGHIYDLAHIRLLLMYDYVWSVAGGMSVSDDWGIPQDSFLLILHHLFRLMLILALCFHFDAIVPAYAQVQLGSYLVMPVKVLICC